MDNNWNDPPTPRVRNLTHYWFVWVVWAQVRIIPSNSDVKNPISASYQFISTLPSCEMMLYSVYIHPNFVRSLKLNTCCHKHDRQPMFTIPWLTLAAIFHQLPDNRFDLISIANA
jgi:hypothetical protein